jgi:hypothetical protein
MSPQFDHRRVGGELEAIAAMRLDGKELQIVVQAGLGDSALLCRTAYAPVGRAVFGLLMSVLRISPPRAD